MTELLKLINKCNTDDEIKNIIDTYIKDYTILTEDTNQDGYVNRVIGRDIDINPHNNHILFANNCWYSFVPKDVKVVYMTIYDDRGFYNAGGYYYVNNDEYLYEFAKLIKGEKIEDFNTFLAYVYLFVRNYFDNDLFPIDREIMNKLILDKNSRYYKPTKEPDITDFKHKGSALCSEYSTMTQNILSLFGYDVLLIFDEKHAYNIYYEDDKAFIIDMQTGFNIYDYNLNIIGTLPYIVCIEDYSEEKLYNVLKGDDQIELDDIDLYKYTDNSFPLVNDCKRIYGADKIKKITINSFL